VHEYITFIQAAGFRLECLDIPARLTNRPTLLLLHEGLGSVSLWRDFPMRLAERIGCRTVAYSRAGFGRSSARDKPWSARFMHEEALEVLPALRSALGIEHTILVGHSTGASMALIHAARHEAVGVVAIAPFVFVEASNLESIRSARDRYSELRPRLARHHDDVDGVFHGWNDLWLDASFRDWNIRADLSELRCPVLAILGERDEYSTPAQLSAIEEHARQARVERLVLHGVGHAPHRDGPEAVLAAIERFVKALEN
jgi:pimeloyl-ACP methyl ester carboxylesterase